MAAARLTIILAFLFIGAVKTTDFPSALKMNLEELAQVNECRDYNELSTPDRSVDYTNDTIDKCDAELSPGWYRFTESAGSHMTSQCAARHHCSSLNPGWMEGNHPAVHEGVVGRKVCFQSDESCCYGSMKILVRNCGEFFVYLLFGVPCPFRYCGSHWPPEVPTLIPATKELPTTTAPPTTTALPTTTAPPTTTALPPFPPALKAHRTSDECHNYTPLTSRDRSATFYSPFTAKGDYKLESGWYRFMGKAGDKMADTCIPRFHCGTHSPGWLLGGHPEDAEDQAVERAVCFNWKENCCYFKQDILVRQCKGYFVYKLKQNEIKFLRYCGNGITAV